MDKEDATEIIAACAEADYDGPSYDRPRATHRAAVESWIINATKDDVRGAVEALGGIEQATTAYIAAWDAHHDDEYTSDEGE